MSLTKVQINLGTTGNLSGSRSLASGSFASRITTAETELTNTILSSSVQIETDISGSFGNQRVGTTDSPTFNAITAGTATITGTLTAQEIHSEFESASILFTSGSTHFGNSSDDIHNMTGSLNVSGGINLNDGTLTVTDNVDFNGDLDVDGTTNLDVVDIDGAVDMASTLNVGGHLSASANVSIIKGGAMLNIEEVGGSKSYIYSGGSFTAFRTTSNTPLQFGANYSSADTMYIKGDKVGIGTNNPGSLLHVYAADGESVNTHVAQFVNLEATDGDSEGVFIRAGNSSNDGALEIQNRAGDTVMFKVVGDGKVGVNESSFSYTDYSVFHIKGRGSDDSNVTGVTFHAGGTDSNQRNWSITTNNSAHGSMDFRVSNANNNTPNTNLVMTMEKDSTIVHKGATQFEGNTTVTADPGKLGVGAAVNSNVGSSMDVIQVGFTSQWYAEKTDSADRNVYIGNNFYHNGSYHRAIYEDQVCGIQFRAGDIKFRTTGSVPTSTNLEAGGGRARMVVHDDGRVSVGYDQTGGHDLEHDSALVVSSSGASGPLTRNAITAVGFCGAGSFNFGQSTVTFDNIKGDGPCFTLRNLGSSHTDRGPFQVYNGSTRILETRNAGEIRGDFVDTSDGDFKQNITTITSSLKEVNKLRPVTYVWKQDEENGQNRGHGQTNIGLIAQEVSESIPELVTGVSGSSSGLGINTLGVTAVLTKAIQELTQAHKDLRAMITGSSDLGQLKALVSGSSFV